MVVQAVPPQRAPIGCAIPWDAATPWPPERAASWRERGLQIYHGYQAPANDNGNGILKFLPLVNQFCMIMSINV